VIHPDVNIISFRYPCSDPDKFFGWGERKGNFFLQDNTQYSLYSNPNNIEDKMQHNEKVVTFGKNGFFPIVYN
jgi:hypothetical protein